MPRHRAPVENGNGGPGMPMLTGAPWYVKLVIWLLVWFGFPVMMSIVLLMVIVGYIPSPLLTLDKNMGKHMQDMDRAIALMETSTRIQRQMCRNTSSNPAERVECDR